MLQALRVIDFASMVAGPAAAGFLADWGADVIKIEPHEGDKMRARPGSPLGSANYDPHNRGKRSIALDTSAPDTRDIILRLVRDADLFITNLLPDRLARLQLDYETLHALNPRMVYGSVSSFGQVGPDRNRGASDNLGFWARGGGTGLLTVEGRDPLPIRQAVGDRSTGMCACAGMLAALFEAQRTGIGRWIDTSLIGAGMWAFATDYTNMLNYDRSVPSRDRHAAAIPLANYFRTRDGRWLQLNTDLPEFAAAVGRLDLLADPRFASPRLSREMRAALVDEADAIIGAMDLAELAPLLDAGKVKFEPIQTLADVVADPAVTANHRIVAAEREGRPFRQIASPCVEMRDGAPVPHSYRSPPRLGEHAEAILAELGYDEADVARMRANGTLPAAA
ncbi:MAG: CoA transferase [Sphingomonadaceae bacterium]|nr:CoA transferase [Sphingomonadaceae bacterium]